MLKRNWWRQKGVDREEWADVSSEDKALRGLVLRKR